MKSKIGIFFQVPQPKYLRKMWGFEFLQAKIKVEIAKSAILTLIMRIKPGKM